MLVYPSLAASETNLVVAMDAVATMPYWRVGVSVGPLNEAPIPPLGCVTVAWINQKPDGFGRQPRRFFYLSCMGPAKHFDGVDADHESTNLIVPSSIVPGAPAMQRATKFGWSQRRSPAGQALESLLKSNRMMWGTYAQRHGLTLPSHVTHAHAEF